MDVFSRRKRDNLRATLDQKIRALMIGVAAQPILLTEVVAGGPQMFRIGVIREFHGAGLPMDEHTADLIFRFFCQKVMDLCGPTDNPQAAAGHYLDRVEVKSPRTDAEIEASWVHEVFSQEEGRRLYKDGPGMAGDSKVILH